MSTTEQKPLEEMTVKELRTELGEAGVDAPPGTKKELLVRLVESARSKPERAPETPVPVDAAPAHVGAAAAAEPQEPPAEAEPIAEEESEDRAISAAGQALALREEAVVQAPALLPSVAEFTAMREMAAAIANTAMVPKAFQGKPDDVLAAILTGREMGLGPMQSLRDLYVIDGKPSLAAHLLLAQLRKGGVVVLESETTRERAWVKVRRGDTGEVAEFEYTFEEASTIMMSTWGERRGERVIKPLVEKDNWVNYREDMLWARLVGRIARRFGPDLIGNALPYTSEEVQDWDDPTTAKFGGDEKTGTWQPPTDWKEFGERFAAAVGKDAAPEWMGQLAEVGYAFDTIHAVVTSDEVTAEVKADLWRRLLRVLDALEAAGEVQIRPDAREVVQKAFAVGFDGLVLDGPEWALTGAEAETGRPARGAETPSDAGAAEGEPEAAATEPEAEEAEWEPAEPVPAESGTDDLANIPF